MSNIISNNNLENLKHNSLDWNLIQKEMKNKLGVEIYESWLKKIDFLEEFNIIYYYLFLQGLFETG